MVHRYLSKVEYLQANSLEELNADVDKHVRMGYEPFERVSTIVVDGRTIFVQTMNKYNESYIHMGPL